MPDSTLDPMAIMAEQAAAMTRANELRELEIEATRLKAEADLIAAQETKRQNELTEAQIRGQEEMTASVEKLLTNVAAIVAEDGIALIARQMETVVGTLQLIVPILASMETVDSKQSERLMRMMADIAKAGAGKGVNVSTTNVGGVTGDVVGENKIDGDYSG